MKNFCEKINDKLLYFAICYPWMFYILFVIVKILLGFLISEYYSDFGLQGWKPLKRVLEFPELWLPEEVEVTDKTKVSRGPKRS